VAMIQAVLIFPFEPWAFVAVVGVCNCPQWAHQLARGKIGRLQLGHGVDVDSMGSSLMRLLQDRFFEQINGDGEYPQAGVLGGGQSIGWRDWFAEEFNREATG